MNIKKAKADKDGLEMCVAIPVTMENNAYLEKLSDTEGLRFSDILDKMIKEHKFFLCRFKVLYFILDLYYL